MQRLERRGLWIRRARGGWTLVQRRSLLPFLALPLVLLGALLLAWNRQTSGLGALLQEPDGETALQVARTFAAANELALDNLFSASHIQPADLPRCDLRVNGRALEALATAIRTGDRMLGHDPGGNKPYVPARYRDESGRWAKAGLCYRGATSTHWRPEKPSLRVRLRKLDARDGRRYVELQRPEDVLALANLLPEELGRELDVLGNLSDPVRVFVNDKYRGVYLRTTRPGEYLSAGHERLPGTFFKGDVFGINPARLWREPGLWRITDPTPEAIAAFRELLSLLSAPRGPERDRGLRRLLDVDAFARWSAVMALAGGVRTDYSHNHLLFWNTYRGRFEPAIWDVNGYGLATRPHMPVDLVLQPFQDWLTRDPSWVHRRNLLLQGLLDGPGGLEAQRERIRGHLAPLLPALGADPHLSEVLPGTEELRAWPTRRLPDKVAALDAWLEGRVAYLRLYLSLARYRVEPAGLGRVRVAVHGTAAVRVTGPNGLDRVLFPGLSEATFVGDQQRAAIARPYVVPVARGYEFEAEPDQLQFTNAVTGQPAQPDARPGAPGATRTADPDPAPSARRHVLEGEVSLEHDLVIGPHETLEIRPGATLRLAANVGIYCEGRLLAEGREDAPIRLLPSNPEVPWGCLGLSGAATAGSRLRYVSAEGGSIGRLGWIQFKGMVNAYHCPDLELSHCRFARNQVGDDLVNLAQSRVTIRSCAFEDARADGLDLDRCRGTLRELRFLRCGNDGLDLMWSRVVVDDSVFADCGDKGVSVGESTRLLLRRASVRRCAIGVEVKDASAAVIEESALDECQRGLHLYMKKWRYGVGGAALLARTRISATPVAAIEVEERALAILCRVDIEGLEAQRGVLEIDEPPARWVALRAGLLRDVER